MDVLLDFLLNFYGPMPYLVIFGILMACGFGSPIPEDIVLIAAGLMAYYGVSNVWGMIIISLVGVMLGDGTLFVLGSRYGKYLVKKWPFKLFLKESVLDSMAKRLHEKGNHFIFAARFMPGLRAPIFFTAGTLKLPFRIFFFYDGLAALLSVPAIIGGVYYFGDNIDRVVRIIKKVEHGIVFVILAIVALLILKWYISSKRKPQDA